MGVDILPTLASFAGIPLLAGHDGFDAWSVLTGGPATKRRTEIPINIDVNPMGGIPWWVFKLPHDGAVDNSALISWPWKVVVGMPFVKSGGAKKEDKPRYGWWSLDINT